jgi:Family of unknown function (DUF6090)
VSERRGAIPLGHFVVEALLIFASVYVAIFLQGRADDRRDAREAREALAQMLTELRGDQADLVEVHASQDSLSVRYEALDRWLSDPATMPGDSVSASLLYISLNNRTMFPRHAAWTTMVAAGQLANLDDPALVTRLGNLYENVMPRIEYNGRYYDESLDATLRMVSETWDSSHHRLGPGGEASVLRLRESLHRVWVAWNEYYIDLLDDYGELVDEAAAAVETYLRAHGIDG